MLVLQHRGNAAASFSWSLTANFALFVYVVKRSTVLLLALDFSGHVCVFFLPCPCHIMWCMLLNSGTRTLALSVYLFLCIVCDFFFYDRSADGLLSHMQR